MSSTVLSSTANEHTLVLDLAASDHRSLRERVALRLAVRLLLWSARRRWLDHPEHHRRHLNERARRDRGHEQLLLTHFAPSSTPALRKELLR